MNSVVIFNILHTTSYTFVFIFCAAVAYMTMQQPVVNHWLADANALVKAVIFVVLTGLLSHTLSGILVSIAAILEGIIGTDVWSSSIAQSLGGLLRLSALVAGITLLFRKRERVD